MDSTVVSHFWNVLMVSLRSARVDCAGRNGVEERSDMVDVAEPSDELPGEHCDGVVVAEDENEADLRNGVLCTSCWCARCACARTSTSSSSSVMSRLSVCVPWSAKRAAN